VCRNRASNLLESAGPFSEFVNFMDMYITIYYVLCSSQTEFKPLSCIKLGKDKLHYTNRIETKPCTQNLIVQR